ncbi:hypothetical protein SESBI_22586 [Sesbania bispinosa]|nr:hypothetical protein SESBI_22586 [Sesbania bispinosa]
MEERVCDTPWTGSSVDWFYVYDYCLTTFGIWISFLDFQMRVLNSLHICPSQFYLNGWAFARTIPVKKLFSPYTDTYKRRNVPFRHEFWRVVSCPGVPPFWKHPRTRNPLFNWRWTQEHFFQPSNRYYVLRTQLSSEQEHFSSALETVAQKRPFSNWELLDAAKVEVIALLDSMAQRNIMAEMRRAKLERQGRNLATPPPTHSTPTSAPKVDNGEGSNQPVVVASKPQEKEVKITGQGDLVKDSKEIPEGEDQNEKKRGESDPSSEPISSEPPTKQQRTDVVGGSSAAGVALGAKSVHPSVWDDHFVLGRGPIRAAVNNFVYTSKDLTFLSDQSPVDVARKVTRSALQIASVARHMEESFVPVFRKAEEDLQAAQREIKVLKEQNKKLEEESTKLVDGLKSTREALSTEIFFKDLADKEKNALQVKYDDARLQIKNAEDSYLEAKAESDKAKGDLKTTQANLEKTLKELEQTNVELLKSKSEYTILNEKFDDAILNLGAAAYENTVQQLKILNPNLVVLGSNPCAYVINGVIMEDSAQAPIPFVPRMEVIGDSDQASVLGLGKKVEGLKVEDPVPSSSQQQPKEDPEVASKDATIHPD